MVKQLEWRTTIKKDDFKQGVKLIHKNKLANKTKSEVTIIKKKKLSDYVSTTIKAEWDFPGDVTEIEGAISVDAGGKKVPPSVHTSIGLLNDTLKDFDQ